MATTYVPTSPNPGVLALPGEIRNEIYRMLLTTRYTFPNDPYETSISLHPAILSVNRQINQEATNVLHGDNFWIIAQINVRQWPKSNAFIPFVSRKDPSHIKYPALHVKLDLPRETMPTESTTLIMGVESLPFLLHELRRRSISGDIADDLKAAGLTLRLYSSPFHSQQKLRSTCLEPFTLVRGFGKYSVIGKPDQTSHLEDMISRAISPFKDTGVVKGIAMDYLAQGDEAYSQGKWFMAHAYYSFGKSFLRHAGESLLAYRRTQGHYSHVQRVRDDFEMETARGVLMAHHMRPLMVKGKHKLIIRAGEHSLLGPPFLPKVEQVGVMLCRALSCASVGDEKEWQASIMGACKLEVTMHDFVQMVLSVCPEPLREFMRVREEFFAGLFKMKNQYDEVRCKEKREDESTRT